MSEPLLRVVLKGSVFTARRKATKGRGSGDSIFYGHFSCYLCGNKASLGYPQCSAKKEKDLRLCQEKSCTGNRQKACHDLAWWEAEMPFWSLKS